MPTEIKCVKAWKCLDTVHMMEITAQNISREMAGHPLLDGEGKTLGKLIRAKFVEDEDGLAASIIAYVLLDDGDTLEITMLRIEYLEGLDHDSP